MYNNALIAETKHKIQNYKEVFVKHEQAPTAPKLEGVWVFVYLKYIFYENRYFWAILVKLTTSGRVF